ncbi:glycosyltransferase family 4 protein [Candidatus Bathyarchaeota archaeon]|nr:glycosyltransferase family 4 protein [Candidatus Bathyarchaeota archaeon]
MVPTKLCVVTHTFLPHVGGIERVVYEQSKRLLQKRFELMVLTNRIGTAKQYSYDGIKVQCYDSLSIGFRLGIPYPVPNVTSYKTFLESVKSSDLIHAHGHPYLSSFMAAKLAKKYLKPFVLTQHNTFIEYGNFWNTVERLNDFAVGKAVLKEADKIIVVSKATMNYVLSLGADPEKIELLYNGVDLERFKPLTGVKDAVREKLGISKNAVVVITVRRLVYKNGIDTLIDSAKIAIKKNPKLVFLAVGEGPDFAEVKARIEQLGIRSNFRLTGFVSDEDLPLYYNAADFSVLPSKSGEGLPLVALEAMACGLPVVATKVGGISEVMMTDYGKIVPPDNPDALAEAILEFSHRELSTLKNGLRARIEQKFSWDKNVEKLVAIYEELI